MNFGAHVDLNRTLVDLHGTGAALDREAVHRALSERDHTAALQREPVRAGPWPEARGDLAALDFDGGLVAAGAYDSVCRAGRGDDRDPLADADGSERVRIIMARCKGQANGDGDNGDCRDREGGDQPARSV
jgi:hypothetical protein